MSLFLSCHIFFRTTFSLVSPSLFVPHSRVPLFLTYHSFSCITPPLLSPLLSCHRLCCLQHADSGEYAHTRFSQTLSVDTNDLLPPTLS